MKAIERIYQYIDYKNINKSDFEKKCGISNGYLGKMYGINADIGESILLQIIENCPEVSPEWILTGNGSMLKSDKIEIKPIDNEYLLRRFEEIVAENTLLKKKIEELELSRGTSPDTPNYDISQKKIGSYIAAEPEPSKRTH